MSRNPVDRYQTALEMKQDLDHPEQVQVTGRAERLVAPKTGLASRWRGARMGILAAGVPIVGFVAVYVIKHLQWK